MKRQNVSSKSGVSKWMGEAEQGRKWRHDPNMCFSSSLQGPPVMKKSVWRTLMTFKNLKSGWSHLLISGELQCGAEALIPSSLGVIGERLEGDGLQPALKCCVEWGAEGMENIAWLPVVLFNFFFITWLTFFSGFHCNLYTNSDAFWLMNAFY